MLCKPARPQSPKTLCPITMTHEVNDIDKAHRQILEDLNEDFLPFHDIYRTLYGFDRLIPTPEQFHSTIKLFNKIIDDKNVVCLEGPSLTPTAKSQKELSRHLNEQFENGKYDHINYAFWIDLKSNWA